MKLQNRYEHSRLYHSISVKYCNYKMKIHNKKDAKALFWKRNGTIRLAGA
jgi:hypothetical protein